MIRAVRVRASAVGGRTVGTAAVTVFRIPIVRAGGRIGVLDFVHYAGVRRTRGYFHIMRRRNGMTVAVAEPDGIAVAKHDVVGAGAAVDGLVEVVAHRVVVSETL